MMSAKHNEVLVVRVERARVASDDGIDVCCTKSDGRLSLVVVRELEIRLQKSDQNRTRVRV